MGYLDKLEISNRIVPAAKPRREKRTIEYRRGKLVANLEEQIELVRLVLEDKPPRLKRKRGSSVVAVRPRLWWVTTPDGHVLTQIRYNKIVLNLAGRGTTIEVDSLERLPAVYRTVIKATNEGELDQAIEAAAIKSR